MSEDPNAPAADWLPFTVLEATRFAYIALTKALDAQQYPVPLNPERAEFFRDPEGEGVGVCFPTAYNFGFVGLQPLPDKKFVVPEDGFTLHVYEEAGLGVMALFEPV